MSARTPTALDRLRADWDARAAADALAASCGERTDWTEASFLASGRAFVAARIAPLLGEWAAGMKLAPDRLRVLDLGCGAGRLVPALRALCGEVWAVDVSPRMLERARALAAGDGVRLALSDGLSLQCANRQTFHLAVCIDVLAHQPDDDFVRYLLGQVQDKLAPGGILVADVPAAFAGPRLTRALARSRLRLDATEPAGDRLWLRWQRPIGS